MSESEGEGTTLEYTPTWVVAAVCSVIVVISLAVERIIHYSGKYLKKKDQKPLFDALQKIKEELMLLGFISLLLTVFQSRIAQICITEDLATHWLPCKRHQQEEEEATTTTSHFQSSFSSSIRRHLLNEGSSSHYCTEKGKVPLLSSTALHHLHIFIFVLAVVHVTICALTIVFGGLKIRQWKAWEDSIAKKECNPEEVVRQKFTPVQDHEFIRSRFKGMGKISPLLAWLHSFFKQFYASVTKSDYVTLRTGFIMTHCRGNPNFNFHKYMMRAFEVDFRKVVGISWYLWLFVVVFLLLNVSGWNAYFWIAFVPFMLLLAVGTKLEHVITQLAHEVAEKHDAIEGELVVQPSDDHFWFQKPKIVLILIHILLFQNSFELAFFFWILIQYGFDSCIMGELGLIIPRLVIGVFVQLVCSYSTLPLYAIVTQMGSAFKKEVFEENIQKGLVGWAQHARKKKGLRKGSNGVPKSEAPATPPPAAVGFAVQLAKMGGKKSSSEGNGGGGEIDDTANVSK